MWPAEIPDIWDWELNPKQIEIPDYNAYYCTKPMFGADPEYFCKHNKYGRPYPPPFQKKEELNKEKRVDVYSSNGSLVGQVQQDGFAMECNLQPVEIDTRCLRNIKQVDEYASAQADVAFSRLSALRDTMDSMLEPYNMELIRHTAVRFWKKDYETQPKEVKEIGCAPDILLAHAWVNGEENNSRVVYHVTKGVNPDPTQRRYAGGHIHIGWTKNWDVTDPWHIYNASVVITWLANVVYPSLLAMEALETRRAVKENPDLPVYKHKRMYSLYGNPFLCRITPYGVEWRCPSNAWTFKKEYVEWIFQLLGRLFYYDSGVYMPEGMIKAWPNLIYFPGEHKPERALYKVEKIQKLNNLGINCRDLPLFYLTRGTGHDK